jgi:hypothetical protein
VANSENNSSGIDTEKIEPLSQLQVFVDKTERSPAFWCIQEGNLIKSSVWAQYAKPQDLTHALIDSEGKVWLGLGTRYHADLASGMKIQNSIADYDVAKNRLQVALDKQKRVISISTPTSWTNDTQTAVNALIAMIPPEFVHKDLTFIQLEEDPKTHQYTWVEVKKS